MKAKHVFGGHMYLICNYGVARNPIFKDEEDLEFFKEKFDQYLGEICEVHASCHQINQFQYLIKIKERPELEAFYTNKQKKKKKNQAHDLYDINSDEIPESYLIFSQEVSNMLNSVAKRFNFRHGRKGSLFGSRYSKELVESEVEMNAWVARLNALEPLIHFEEDWKTQENLDPDLKAIEASSQTKKVLSNNYLRGCFESLPPVSTNSALFTLKFNNFIKIHGKNPPW